MGRRYRSRRKSQASFLALPVWKNHAEKNLSLRKLRKRVLRRGVLTTAIDALRAGQGQGASGPESVDSSWTLLQGVPPSARAHDCGPRSRPVRSPESLAVNRDVRTQEFPYVQFRAGSLGHRERATVATAPRRHTARATGFLQCPLVPVPDQTRSVSPERSERGEGVAAAGGFAKGSRGSRTGVVATR